jgi:hypothetical protein
MNATSSSAVEGEIRGKEEETQGPAVRERAAIRTPDLPRESEWLVVG